MTSGPPRHPLFAVFEQGREPLFVTRYEGHGAGSAETGVHAYAVVVFVSKGLSRVRHAGNLELRPGDVHLIPPGDAHGTAHFDHASGWVLGFWPEQSSHSLRLFSQVRRGCHPVLRPTATQRQRLEQWLLALEEESEGAAAGREDALAALLQLVLVELGRVSASPLQGGSEASSLARQVLEYVELHALRPLTLSDVARAVARTPAHVATVVRRETGRTVGEWILTQRMGEARRRLRGTDAPIDLIARQVGYADVTHFIRQFRRVHKTTPARWKRAQHTRSGR
jgi:AraC-like DNA-binding protein